MKKIFPFLVVVIFILSGFGVNAISISDIKTDKVDKIIFNDDELDQSQTIYEGIDGIGYILGMQITAVQEFIPRKDILTRVFIYTYKNAQPDSFNLAIRSELDGENLTTTSVPSTAVPSGFPEWVEFDFEDIPVTPGEKYYIVLSTPKKIECFYLIGFGTHNQYPDGFVYYNIDWGEWNVVEESDVCFKTYGRNYPLDIVFNGGFGSASATITNNFGYDLENIHWGISVQGGFLNGINKENSGVISTLEDLNAESIAIDDFIFGLGKIRITVFVEVESDLKITRIADGFVLLFVTIV